MTLIVGGAADIAIVGGWRLAAGILDEHAGVVRACESVLRLLMPSSTCWKASARTGDNRHRLIVAARAAAGWRGSSTFEIGSRRQPQRPEEVGRLTAALVEYLPTSGTTQGDSDRTRRVQYQPARSISHLPLAGRHPATLTTCQKAPQGTGGGVACSGATAH